MGRIKREVSKRPMSHMHAAKKQNISNNGQKIKKLFSTVQEKDRQTHPPTYTHARKKGDGWKQGPLWMMKRGGV